MQDTFLQFWNIGIYRNINNGIALVTINVHKRSAPLGFLHTNVGLHYFKYIFQVTKASINLIIYLFRN